MEAPKVSVSPTVSSSASLSEWTLVQLKETQPGGHGSESFAYSLRSLSVSSDTEHFAEIKSKSTKACGEHLTELGEKELRTAWARRNAFPPPISCLRSCRNGKPFEYFRIDEKDNSYVLEKIRIPEGNLLRASTEDGRLKLYS